MRPGPLGGRAARSPSRSLLAVAALVALPGPLAAQVTFGAAITPVVTRADPAPGGSSLTELRFTAPLLYGTADLLGGRVRFRVTLDGEGLTMPHGVLATGDFGEGWEDRRHPHTWAHELLASASDLAPLPGGVHWSLTAGKGFAPYGTDDPMMRPALSLPGEPPLVADPGAGRRDPRPAAGTGHPGGCGLQRRRARALGRVAQLEPVRRFLVGARAGAGVARPSSCRRRTRT